MKHDPILLGCRRDGFCRCPRCKPALGTTIGMTPGDVAFAICAALICLAMAAIMPGGR